MSTDTSFLTIQQAAARMGVHESTVRRYADRGLIGVRRLPSGVRRLHRADVDGLAARMEDKSDRSAPTATLNDLSASSVWRSDEELDQFLALTYAERDRDR
jgi:excisionase family DNA binding protein